MIFFALRTNAQLQDGDVSLNISPEYPKANQDVRASLSSYSVDLNNTRISWILNSETIISGVGKKSFSFKTGNPGSVITLEVKVETINGSIIKKKKTINTTDVDMLWEAYDTYVPPFYKGKTLVPEEGMVKVVAFPNVQNLAGFNYKWKSDDDAQVDSSGYEKNYFIYKNSYLEDSNKTGVNVSDIFGNGVGEGEITISPGVPKILIYRKDPNLGIKWENALTDYFFINPAGETLVAEPYFFYPKNLASENVSLKWVLNGEEVALQNPINSLAIKLVSGQSGDATIQFIINNTQTLFESVQKQLNVSF